MNKIFPPSSFLIPPYLSEPPGNSDVKRKFWADLTFKLAVRVLAKSRKYRKPEVNMKRIFWTIMLLLFAVGNNSAATLHCQTEKNAPIKTVTCDSVLSNEIETKLAEDNAIKLALYQAFVSRKGVVKAKKVCATIEGDPLPVYATAKDGTIKITRDYSQDRWFKFQGLLKFFGGNSYTTRKVEIGYLVQGKFIPLRGGATDGRRLFLRLKGKDYF